MILRKVRASDAGQIAALINIFIRETTVSFTTEEKTAEGIKRDIASRLGESLPWIVAEGPDGLAGYATAAPFRKGEGYARTMEHSLFVSPSAQRQRVGQQLMGELEAVLARRGALSMVAGISAENTVAVEFHLSMGFEEVGRVERAGFKFDRMIDLVLLQKHLSRPSDSG